MDNSLRAWRQSARKKKPRTKLSFKGEAFIKYVSNQRGNHVLRFNQPYRYLYYTF